jgi:hypothetical protein
MSFVSDILSNTRRASSRTKKRQQKQQKIITTKPSSDRPLREREKTQQKSKVADREERERERCRRERIQWSVLLVGGGTTVGGAPMGGGRWVCNERERKLREKQERERQKIDGRSAGSERERELGEGWCRSVGAGRWAAVARWGRDGGEGKIWKMRGNFGNEFEMSNTRVFNLIFKKKKTEKK